MVKTVEIHDLSIVRTWLDCEIEDLEYELPSGKMATELTVTEDALLFSASETFGSGMEPYAASPETHKEYLNSPDVVRTEGSVQYGEDDNTLSLPKTVYFQEKYETANPIEPGPAEEVAERFRSELSRALGGDSVSVTVPENLAEIGGEEEVAQ